MSRPNQTKKMNPILAIAAMLGVGGSTFASVMNSTNLPPRHRRPMSRRARAGAPGVGRVHSYRPHIHTDAWRAERLARKNRRRAENGLPPLGSYAEL